MKTTYWRPFAILFLFLLTFHLSFSALVDIDLLTILLKPLSGSSTPYTIASTAPLYSLSNTNMTNTVNYTLPPESFGNSYNIEFIELYRTLATGVMSTATVDVRIDIPSKTQPKTSINSNGETIVVSTLIPASTTVFTTTADGQTQVYTSTVPASVMTVTVGAPITKSTGQPKPTNSGGCRVREGKTLIWTMMSVWLGYWVTRCLYSRLSI